MSSFLPVKDFKTSEKAINFFGFIQILACSKPL